MHKDSLAGNNRRPSTIAIALLTVAATALLDAGCIEDSRGRSPRASFSLESLEPSRCSEKDARFKCFEAQITNVGQVGGEGTCTLRPRHGSTARYVQGGTTQRMALSESESVKVRIVVMAGPNGRFVSPSVYCNPGIGG
jgi:hypothetical protein